MRKGGPKTVFDYITFQVHLFLYLQSTISGFACLCKLFFLSLTQVSATFEITFHTFCLNSNPFRQAVGLKQLPFSPTNRPKTACAAVSRKNKTKTKTHHISACSCVLSSESPDCWQRLWAAVTLVEQCCQNIVTVGIVARSAGGRCVEIRRWVQVGQQFHRVHHVVRKKL